MSSNIFNKKIIHFFSFIILFTHFSAAQYEDSTFIRYTVKEGLSENYVTSLQQDGLGFLWIGTTNGLNQFDGNSFKKYYQGSKKLPLTSGKITKLLTFGPGHLGIISHSGFQLLDTKDFSLQNYFIPDSTAFSTYRNSGWSSVQLSIHSFALTTATGFYVFNRKSEIIFRHDAHKPEDAGKKRILYGRDIFPLNDEECIVYVNENSIALYNIQKKKFREIDTSENKWKIFQRPVTPDNHYWINKFQLNKNEFIFTLYNKDSIFYYNHTQKKMVSSPLPFRTKTELIWNSRLEMLSDSSFAITSWQAGFYLFHINRTTGKIVCEPRKYLAEYKINSLFLDKDKRLWVGTTRGLLRQKQAASFIKKYHYSIQSPDYSDPGFQNAYRHNDKLYLCRYSRFNGLVMVDTASMKIEKRFEFYGRDNKWNEISTIQMFHPDTLWLGTNNGILWFDTKTHHYGKVLDEKKYQGYLGGQVILAPLRADGYAWFCYLLSGVVGRYHIASRSFTFFTSKTQPVLPFDNVKSVVYDSFGDVWIGGHGLTRWNNKKHLFDTLITVYGGVNKFNDDILTLSADANGSLWLHNTENGLLEYRIKEKKFIAYTMNDGLPSIVIACLSPVIQNILWIGSFNHLTRFNTQTKKSFVYDYYDGLPDERPSSRRVYYDSAREKFYMFCMDWLVEFPLQPQATKVNNSKLLIQELVVNNNKFFYYPGDLVKLKYNENNLSLHFNIIEFELSKSNRFEYRLNNAESWTALANQRSINLNELQPGKHLVQIKTISKSGEEEMKIFTIIIKPPIWKTEWFLICCSLLLVGFIYLLYRYRINQIRQKANIDKQLSQTEMKALHAQMNPHFVFNSLNSIREMILNNKNIEASHFLSKFAQLIRVTLDQSSNTFVSLRNTLDYLHRYIEMEQIRNNNFTCGIVAEEELDPDEILLPPMLIQPFIENAIWHGVSGIRTNIHISIYFKKQGNHLVCFIDDNGIGIEQSLLNKKDAEHTHHSVGISNIKNRLHLLNKKYKQQCSVTIEDKCRLPGYEETGTLVSLRLPLYITEE